MQILGYIAIQPDWPLDIKEPGRFWVSAYMKDRPSIHGHIQVTASTQGNTTLVSLDPQDDATGNITAEYLNYRQLRLSCPALGIPPAIYSAPQHSIQCLQFSNSSGVHAFDLSPHGGLLAAGGPGGHMHVYETQHHQHRVELEGHLGDITACKFFPSGQVVLSGSTDMSLKIWSASDGTNPVTLSAHRAAISDAAIVGKGKNVVSASRDGTVRAWRCGTSELLHTFEVSKDAINAIRLVGTAAEGDEFEMQGKQVVCALEDGRVVVLDLGQLKTVGQLECPGRVAARSISVDQSNSRLAVGRSDGVADIWDFNPTDPGSAKLAYSFQRNNSPISAVEWATNRQVCVGTEDGQLFKVALETMEVAEEMVAFDVDPVTQICKTSSGIWASGRTNKIYEF